MNINIRDQWRGGDASSRLPAVLDPGCEVFGGVWIGPVGSASETDASSNLDAAVGE